MPKIINKPARIRSLGNKTKIIDEFIGLANSQSYKLSIAIMNAPQGWSEKGQTPEFDEYTVVLEGELNVETKNGINTLEEGQAIIVFKGEWVRYSTPKSRSAKYIAVCSPAFSDERVNRDEN